MQIPFRDIVGYVPDRVGQQVRTNHVDCSAGSDTRQRLYITRTIGSILAYCHNCGGSCVRSTNDKVRHIDVVKSLILRSERAQELTSEVAVPYDTVYDLKDFPTAALAWLFSNQLEPADIAKFQIGYSPSWGRVVLPVYEEGKLVFWQGRRIDGGGTKYISVRSAKKPLFIAGSATHTVVVCEDMLSAIRANAASPAVMSGVALLGTDGPDNLPERLAGHSFIAVWLDGDIAGRLKATALADRLRLCTTAKVACIHDKEPKKLSGMSIAYATGTANYT